MSDRWRNPVKPMAVDDDPEGVDFTAGRPTQGIRYRLHPDDVARIKLGYVCLNCHEPHEVPFPPNCSVCSYPMQAQQQEDFARAFGGIERDRRAIAIEQGLDRVDDTHERRFHQTKTGIVIPRSV